MRFPFYRKENKLTIKIYDITWLRCAGDNSRTVQKQTGNDPCGLFKLICLCQSRDCLNQKMPFGCDNTLFRHKCL
jgi:hypothetical protein